MGGLFMVAARQFTAADWRFGEQYCGSGGSSGLCALVGRLMERSVCGAALAADVFAALCQQYRLGDAAGFDDWRGVVSADINSQATGGGLSGALFLAARKLALGVLVAERYRRRY